MSCESKRDRLRDFKSPPSRAEPLVRAVRFGGKIGNVEGGAFGNCSRFSRVMSWSRCCRADSST